MHFGLIPEILPLKLIEACNSFKTHFKTDDYGSKFPPIIHFVRKFRIPWILKWQYVMIDDKVEKHWYVKWWDKYPQVETTVNNVKELAQALKAQTLLPNFSPLPLAPVAFLPPLVPKEDTVAVTSPVASFCSSKKKHSKKKKEMLKAFLESNIVPKREWFGNFGYSPEHYYPGLEDL
jgi:hypothetical protein